MRVLATFLAIFLASTSVAYTAPVPVHITSSLAPQAHLPNSDVHHHPLPEAAHHELDDEHAEHPHSKHSVAKSTHHHPHMYKHEPRFWGAALFRGARGATKAAKAAPKAAKPTGPKRTPGVLSAFKNKGTPSNKPHANTDFFKKKGPTKHKDDPKQEAACRADGVSNYWNCILYYAKKGEEKLKKGGR